jgi:TRAP-type transport system periplasmic protein
VKSTIAALFTLLLALPAAAQDKIEFKAGSVAPEGTPWAEWLDTVKARIEKDSGNKLKMKVFLGGKLGGEKEMVEEVKKGNLQLFGGSTGAIATAGIPELAALELPYIFSSDAEADFVLNQLREKVAKLLEAKGFKMVMWAENGWHGYGIKGKCVEKPDDLKGLKMRSQESIVHIETYKAYGASPVEMAVPEVLGALQTGTVDGYSNTPLFSFATSWYQGITHYTYSKHIYQPAMLVLSKKWFDAQPEDMKKVLLDKKEERAGLDGVRALTEPLLDNFKAADKKVCRLTPEQTKAWQEKAKPVWDVFGKKNKANKEMVDAILAAKKQFKP